MLSEQQLVELKQAAETMAKAVPQTRKEVTSDQVALACRMLWWVGEHAVPEGEPGGRGLSTIARETGVPLHQVRAMLATVREQKAKLMGASLVKPAPVIMVAPPETPAPRRVKAPDPVETTSVVPRPAKKTKKDGTTK